MCLIDLACNSTMQLENFYTVNDLSVTENEITANITINKDHDIFKGHFPGNPVTPGVCVMQIIKELTETVVGEKLQMKSSSNIKFTAIINPFLEPNLDMVLEIDKLSSGYKVSNITSFKNTIALKLTSTYLISN